MSSKLKLIAGAAALGAVSFALPALAQDETVLDLSTATGVSPATAEVFNTLLFLVMGFLVMWMAAGLRHARNGPGAAEERLDAGPQERRHLCHWRPDVLVHRLQPDVHRR